ncbi:ribonuclease D [Magnetospira sp. QH-2]|uniref:ribonuclease D n=1 Tax=Magnetospira sp. (strain QH-2) TaxID=1288970 RepID=UPI0003E817ED|nr:ribonuclease H-like domain-containing protein [Magnetospira sp. QH-2]CCQ75138.1 putative 3'-5' exonuclease [Magnetospira sp. QH-2]
MKIELHVGDIPPGLNFGDSVAVDTETMGLNPHRDRLCVVQLSAGDEVCHLVHFPPGSSYEAPNLKALMADPAVTKIFHFARFDVAILSKYLGVLCAPIYCTKVASKLVRTNTERHGLKDLVSNMVGAEVSKEQQQSDWGSATLTEDQQHYAAQDVLYLHRLRDRLDELLDREGRREMAEACFRFLPTRGLLDLDGWEDPDILSH